MSTNTKACPVCGKVISVNSKGAMAKHQKTKTCQKYKLEGGGERPKTFDSLVDDLVTEMCPDLARIQVSPKLEEVLSTKVVLDSPQVQDLVWSTIESDNSTQYKDITNYDDIISDLRRSLDESRLQIQNIHQHYQLQIELLSRPFPTCETVNSECQTVAFPTCETECQTETDAVLSECDTVSVKSEGEEIAPRIMKTPPVRKAFGEQLKLEVTSIETSDLNILEYSAKSFVVRGNTKEYKDKLKSLGGKWNPNLTDKETGSRFCGWIFSNSKRVKVDELVL